MSSESGTDQSNVTPNAGENDKENNQGSKKPKIIDAKQAANISDELLACAPVLMDTWEAKKPVKRTPPATSDTSAAQPGKNEEVIEAETLSKPSTDKEPLKTEEKKEGPVQNGEVNVKHEEPERTPEELTPDAISARKEARIKSLEAQIKLQREKAKLSCQRLEQATKLLDMRRKALEDAERKAREAERRIMAMETVLEKTKDPDYDVTSALPPPKDKKAKENELRQICGDMKTIESRSSSARQSTEALEAKMNHLRAEIEKWKGRRDELKDMRDEQKALLAEIPKLTERSDDTDHPPPPSSGAKE